MRDALTIQHQHTQRHLADVIIQALVKCVFDRRYVTKLRAVLIIQRNWRFLFGLKKWKKMKRQSILLSVTRVVTGFIEIAIHQRVKYLVRYHVMLIIRVQAMIRGHLIRQSLGLSREYATRLSIAILVIQRYWRKKHQMILAVEELLLKKRSAHNPYQRLSSVSIIISTLDRKSVV
jgi:uncharacterized membrane protein YfhO